MFGLSRKAAMLFSLPLSCGVFLISCGKDSPAREGQEEGQGTEPKAEFKMTAQAGWDIYRAGTYRYGPSIIVNEDGSIDAWFAANGSSFLDDFGEKLYIDAQTTPVNLSSTEVGVAFTAESPFFDVQAYCPTWNTNGTEAMTMSLYLWNDSYRHTVEAGPVAVKRFEAMLDNSWCEVWPAEGERFPSGRYLLVLGQGTASAGVWFAGEAASIPGRGTVSFMDGEETPGAPYVVLNYDSPIGLSGSYWDQISYQHSTDGGKTWTAEEMVLKPTKGTRDAFSCCDPGVVKAGAYYYLGYTSTENSGGVENHVYMARSKDPRGPWEKWNGTDWGGDRVEPVVTFDGQAGKWGAGGPCMVVLDGTLYLYYTWNDTGTGTRLATAPADDLCWPAHLSFRGTAVNTSMFSAADHCDIKYCEQLQKFIALHTVNAITSSAYLQLWVSSDGIQFHQYGKLPGALGAGLHNVGLSGDASGHLDTSVQQYIGYAYGLGDDFPWGQWNTKWNPLTIDN